MGTTEGTRATMRAFWGRFVGSEEWIEVHARDEEDAARRLLALASGNLVGALWRRGSLYVARRHISPKMVEIIPKTVANRRRTRKPARRANLQRGHSPSRRRNSPMNKKEAYDLGVNEGYGIAIDAEFSPGMSKDEMTSEAFEIEENARQMAGHPTYDIEYESRDAPEGSGDIWFDAYDEGVAVGIRKGLRERFPAKRSRKPKKVANPRTTSRTASGDDVAANELELFAVNDADLYHQQRHPIELNLAKKMQKGVYDHAKAAKLWMYFAESAAKKYAKEQGGTWHIMFTVPTRKLMAESLATQFEAEAKVHGLDRPQPKAARGRKSNTGRRKRGLRTRRNSYTFRDSYGRIITLTDEQEAVLRAFAQKHGRTWRSHLLSLWTSGRDTGVLRQIRNMVGPSSINKIRFNKGRRTKNPRGRCIQPRAGKGRYAICPKGTASKPGKKCRQPRAGRGRFSTCK